MGCPNAGEPVKLIEWMGRNSVNLFYPYINPSPQTKCSSTIPTMDSIMRSYSYNEKRDEELGKSLLGCQRLDFWGSSHGEINSRGDYKTVTDALRNCRRVPSFTVGGKPASRLATGGVTFDVCTQRGVPARIAFIRMCEIITKNLQRDTPLTLRNYCLSLVDLLNMDEILIPIDFYENEEGEVVNGWVTLSNRDFYLRCTTFQPCVKIGEHGKASVRSIFIASIFTKAFYMIAEDAAGSILPSFNSSTIQIGGEEKRKVIGETMFDNQNKMGQQFVTQGDCTKWNETLNAAVMRTVLLSLMSNCDLNDRAIVGCAFAIMQDKRVYLGPGFPVMYGKESGKIKVEEWECKEVKELHPEYYNFLEKQKNRYDPKSNTIEVENGMLMGMMNLCSTLVACVANKAAEIKLKKEDNVILRSAISSDDYISTYTFEEKPEIGRVEKVIRKHERMMKAFGVNPSEAKNKYFESPNCEFTSQYLDSEGFIVTVADKVSGAKPAGVSIRGDISSASSMFLNWIEQGVGMTTATLGMENVVKMFRIMYKIDGHLPNPRTSLGLLCKKFREEHPTVRRAISHGGANIFSPSNLGCNEISLLLEEEPDVDQENYQFALLGDSNPFVITSEEIVKRRDVGPRVTSEVMSLTYFDSFRFVPKRNFTADKKQQSMVDDLRLIEGLTQMLAPSSAVMPRPDAISLKTLIAQKIRKLELDKEGYTNVSASAIRATKRELNLTVEEIDEDDIDKFLAARKVQRIEFV